MRSRPRRASRTRRSCSPATRTGASRPRASSAPANGPTRSSPRSAAGCPSTRRRSSRAWPAPAGRGDRARSPACSRARRSGPTARSPRPRAASCRAASRSTRATPSCASSATCGPRAPPLADIAPEVRARLAPREGRRARCAATAAAGTTRIRTRSSCPPGPCAGRGSTPRSSAPATPVRERHAGLVRGPPQRVRASRSRPAAASACRSSTKCAPRCSRAWSSSAAGPRRARWPTASRWSGPGARPARAGPPGS